MIHRLVIVKELLSCGRDDFNKPFKLINYKGNCSTFEQMEQWIAPYITSPNRPYLVWNRNPNRS